MTGDEIYSLLAPRLQAVLALDALPAPTARFDEDLHADSLDLVEVVEGVEQDLADAGVRVRLPEDELRELGTVRDAAEAFAVHVNFFGRRQRTMCHVCGCGFANNVHPGVLSKKRFQRDPGRFQEGRTGLTFGFRSLRRCHPDQVRRVTTVSTHNVDKVESQPLARGPPRNG